MCTEVRRRERETLTQAEAKERAEECAKKKSSDTDWDQHANEGGLSSVQGIHRALFLYSFPPCILVI